MMTIGYYVHHHGTGHMRRALNIVSNMKSHVHLFSSAPQPSDLPNNVTFVYLPDDKVDGYEPNSESHLPYTPYSDVIFERNRLLTEAWQKYAIRHIHVDVSAEVAVLAKLHGLSVSYTVMNGDRDDASHTLAYDLSNFLLAFSPESFDEKKRHTQTPVKYVGGASRFLKSSPRPLQNVERVVIMTSPQAEKSWNEEIISLANDNRDITWECVGFTIDTTLDNIVSHGKIADPQNSIEQADIVIGSGGNNTIMELSSLAKPFICIPEARPYDEQVLAANKLQELNAALVLQSFPTPEEWENVVTNVRALDLNVFSDLTSDTAALKAAGILDDYAS